MAQAHNILIRGLNAIVLQAPHVPDSSSPDYIEQDVKDLLSYTNSWIKMVHHHHGVEEDYMFPEVDVILGRQGVMAEPKGQHELFHDGLDRLTAYTTETKPSTYKWEGKGGMKEIVDTFAKHLADHLHAEVEYLLTLEEIGDAVAQAFNKAEDIAKKAGSLDLLVRPGDDTSHSIDRAILFEAIRRTDDGYELTRHCSTPCSPLSWAALTRHSRVEARSHPCPGSCLTWSSTGSLLATAPGGSTPRTGGGTRVRSTGLARVAKVRVRGLSTGRHVTLESWMAGNGYEKRYLQNGTCRSRVMRWIVGMTLACTNTSNTYEHSIDMLTMDHPG